MAKIIMDVDPGIDDALALMALCRYPGVDILGVSTVAGNISLEGATKNASGILKELDSQAKVYPGAPGPLYSKGVTATDIHGEGGLGNWEVESDAQRNQSTHGAAFIANCAAQHPGEVVLVATGPLTNIAIALEHHPQEMKNLKELVFMGGALRVAGNITPVAEFNIFADVDAAQVVLEAGLNLTMVGLDITQGVTLGSKDVELLATGGRIAQYAASMVDYFYSRHGEFPLHDPLALMAALEPGLFEFDKLAVNVETRGSISKGKTVADLFGKTHWPKIQVASSVDGEAAKKRLLELWSSETRC